jgi:UDP-N-acetylmuramyl pentapeptide phosphotransferase/UDP-N-acetylglucosamine-1-phosphate transferase
MSTISTRVPALGGGTRSIGIGALAGLLVVVLLMTPGVRRAALGPWLWTYLVALAFGTACLATPLVRALAVVGGVLDLPAARKVHRVATPLLGGVAVYSGFAFTVLANFQFSLPLKGVALGASIVVVLGMLDDILDLPAWVKLAGQIAGTAVAIRYGVLLSIVPWRRASTPCAACRSTPFPTSRTCR